MKNDNISLVIEAIDGRPLRCYSHEGKTFIESHEERAYQLRVKNKTGGKVKAVISVDSLNIVSGESATNDPKETGYILQPYEERVFKGYRVDNDTVAQFKFVKREKSYATEQGSGAGNGVVAIRAYEEKENESDKILKRLQEWQKNQFKEKEYIYIDRPYPVYPRRPWYWEDYWGPRPVWTGGYSYNTVDNGGPVTTSLSLNGSSAIVVGSTNASLMRCASTPTVSACQAAEASAAQDSINQFSAQAAGGSELKAAAFDMGSGWGDSVKDSVREVTFEEGQCIAEISVYYASRESLKVMGIDVERVATVTFPEPFKRQFCARPSGWKG